MIREREQTIYCTLEPGVYVLLAATYLPGMEGPFSITLVSNFSLMDVTQLWPPVWRAQTGLGSTLAAAAMTLAEKVRETDHRPAIVWEGGRQGRA